MYVYELASCCFLPQFLLLFELALLVTSYSLRWEQRGVTIAGDRNGLEGKGKHQLNHPIGLYVDESQTLYIADLGNHRIVS